MILTQTLDDVQIFQVEGVPSVLAPPQGAR